VLLALGEAVVGDPREGLAPVAREFEESHDDTGLLRRSDRPDVKDRRATVAQDDRSVRRGASA